MRVAMPLLCGVTSDGQQVDPDHIIPMWAVSALSLCAAYWAAMFAQIAHLRALDDGVGVVAFAWISRVFLAVGLGLFVVAKGG
ncbi:hypothetical protein [Methylobacterium sp. J-068]|uniref:hypothetical protein n=1 Tax=Methylobacterium sp. J-068 TaxID=2836649 RepID=UPI001FB88791|nr:hypothetical protein [Methylobacterium sp. J-068]MCJ2032637.1 hypothetical protein [Methylobacterium sp. J-068]